MPRIITMPEVLAGAEEGTIVSWSVAEGDAVAVGDKIAELETDKALVDLPANSAGVIGRLLASPGDTAAVGTPLFVLLDEGETLDDVDLEVEKSTTPATPPTNIEPEDSGDPGTPAKGGNQPSGSDLVASEDAGAAPRPAPNTEQRRHFASPLARRLAREQGIDITRVDGTGPRSRVTRRDLERHLANSPASTPQSGPTPEAPTTGAESEASAQVVPHTRMRRTIARRLTESKAAVPHFYLTADCRVDALMRLRIEVNTASTERVSVNDFVVVAAAAALKRVPEANVQWSEEGTVHLPDVDIAVAVATETGLYTPVVRDVNSRRLTTVSADIKDLASRARTSSLRQGELEGGTITVSNLGMYGVKEFGAIINPPQCAILAVGAATPRAVVVDGSIEIATVMTVTMSADHRVLDGDLAARWLAALVEAIENPTSLLF